MRILLGAAALAILATSAPALAQNPAAQPQAAAAQPKPSGKARNALAALQTAVNSNDRAAIATELAKAQAVATTNDDLSRVHTVPDPYYVTSALEQSTDTKILKFVNLPADCIIRIYSSSGVLVSMLEHHSATFGGSEDWNVRNRNNQVVASGVYFYHIESGDARRVGRFTVVNFAQ